jgi:hypothetical protein
MVSGVDCTTATAMTATSNIVHASLNETVAIDGNCSWAFSNIEGAIPGGLDGGNNIDADPLFVDPSLPGGDYHLQGGSPCIDAADPASTVATDIDGDARPAAAGFDIGADEVAE